MKKKKQYSSHILTEKNLHVYISDINITLVLVKFTTPRQKSL